MGLRAKTAGLAIVTALGVTGATEACRAPTQVTLEVTYSGACGELGGVAFIIATEPRVAESRIEGNVFTTKTIECTGGGTPGRPARVGTLVVTPNGSTDRAAIIVIAGVGKPVEECKAKDGYLGCIVARRAFSFVEHASLTLDVPLDRDCKDVPCNEVSTCKRGACVDSAVNCSSDGCSKPGELADGGLATVDAPTSSDAYVQADALFDALIEPPTDAPVDSPVDASGDSGSCELADVALTCDTTPVMTETCAAGQRCCYGFDFDGGSSSGGGGPSKYGCRTNCSGTPSEPEVNCRSAKNCPDGTVCCLGQFFGAPTTCMTKCDLMSFDGSSGSSGGGGSSAQICADDCECLNGTCSVPVTVGTSPPQRLMKCSP